MKDFGKIDWSLWGGIHGIRFEWISASLMVPEFAWLESELSLQGRTEGEGEYVNFYANQRGKKPKKGVSAQQLSMNLHMD